MTPASELHEELLEIADRLDNVAKDADAPEIKEIEVVPVPTGADTPGMVFLGGFGREESGDTTALAFMYTFTGVDDREPA